MAEMPTHDLNKIAKHLRKRFSKLEKGTNTLLKQHFSFGYELSRAKNLLNHSNANDVIEAKFRGTIGF